ncbi:MAG: hydantoinase B/oxoprolinase family protein, partial [Deltaproteobacteria bacterium]|nr:hydantoinase B/oxoprolinase family protein [Deltaproteobacteria bacterium]
FLEKARVSLLTERRLRAPYGLAGGEKGLRGTDELIRNGRKKKLKGKVGFEAEANDLLVIRTPGGGGWGRAID